MVIVKNYIYQYSDVQKGCCEIHFKQLFPFLLSSLQARVGEAFGSRLANQTKRTYINEEILFIRAASRKGSLAQNLALLMQIIIH